MEIQRHEYMTTSAEFAPKLKHKKPLNTLVLFDFDGTLTIKDSLPDFIKFAVGAPSYYFGLLLLTSTLLTFKLKLSSNHTVKEKLISHFFKGWDSAYFQRIADDYALHRIDKITCTEAINKLAWHQSQNHKIVIVSASIECWLKKWCAKQQVELLATKLEFLDGKLTGRFYGKNCHGVEKVNQIKAHLKLSDFKNTYAYGDSNGDKAMLSLANHAFYRCYK